MYKEDKMNIKKCIKCGAYVKVLEDCNCDECGIKCCGKNMVMLKAQESSDVDNKHVLSVIKEDNKVYIKSSHVMENDHFICFVSIVYDNKEFTTYYKPGDKIEIEIDYIKDMKIYSYCNKHELWVKNI